MLLRELLNVGIAGLGLAGRRRLRENGLAIMQNRVDVDLCKLVIGNGQIGLRLAMLRPFGLARGRGCRGQWKHMELLLQVILAHQLTHTTMGGLGDLGRLRVEGNLLLALAYAIAFTSHH